MHREWINTLVRAAVPRPLRNWLRSPSKSVQWVWDATMFSVGVTPTLHIPPNLTIVCHPRVFKVAHEAQIVDPDQSAEFRRFLSSCSDGMFLFDIGAHFGMFSLAAARLGGRAIAVDPSPIATRMMARQVRLNGWSEKIHIIQAAVSDRDGSLDMLSSGVFSDGYFKVVQERSRRDLTRTRTITIDQMASGFGVPSHIKIDVEGQEGPVLRGGKETFRKFSPILFIELHNEMIMSQGGDRNAALDELDGFGYNTFSLNGAPIERPAIFEKPIIRIVASRSS
jgi:FkbM family methyltransferase